MANAEHLKILREGVEGWNEWRRRKTLMMIPDLSDADLSKTDLSRADLRGVNLKRAVLKEANLEGANLREANMEGAFLKEANLRGVNLTGANLSKANLFMANLSKAILNKANLNWAILTKANLTGASLELAMLKGVNLEGADMEGAKLTEGYRDDLFLSPRQLTQIIWIRPFDRRLESISYDIGENDSRENVDSERKHFGYKFPTYLDAKETPTHSDRTLHFDSIFPTPFRSQTWQDMLIYVYFNFALHKVLGDFQQRIDNFVGTFSGYSAESQTQIPKDSLLIIIPDIPSVVCDPPSFQFRMTDDYHCQPFRVMHKTTPVLEKLGRGRIKGAVRIYLETLVIGEIPVESEWEMPGYVTPVQPTLVSSLAAQPQAMSAATTGESFKRQTAQAFRKIFASYADSDTSIVERLEKAYRALGDDYWLQFQRLRSGQDRSKVIEEAIKDSDVFQLCWSNNAKTAENVEREWRLALAIAKENFIRPIYWERPMPEPPEELRHLYFDYYQVGI